MASKKHMKFSIDSGKLFEGMDSAVNKAVASRVENTEAMADSLELNQQPETKVLEGMMEVKEDKIELEELCVLINNAFEQTIEKSFWGLDPKAKELLLEKGKEYSLQEKLAFIVTTVHSQEECRKILLDGWKKKYHEAMNGWKKANEIAKQGVEIVQKLSKEKEESEQVATKVLNKAYNLYTKCNELENKCIELETICNQYVGKCEAYEKALEYISQGKFAMPNSQNTCQIAQNGATENEVEHSKEREMTPYERVVKIIDITLDYIAPGKRYETISNALSHLKNHRTLRFEDKLNGQSFNSIVCSMLGVLFENGYYKTDPINCHLELSKVVAEALKLQPKTIAGYMTNKKYANKECIKYWKSLLN